MELVKQDFCFETHSLTHGRFIVDCNDMYPTGKIVEIKGIYPYKAGHVYLNFDSPEDTATWLKLKYGGALVTPPPPAPPQVFDISLSKQYELLKRQQEKDRYKKLAGLEVDSDYWDQKAIQEKKEKQSAFFDFIQRSKQSAVDDSNNFIKQFLNKHNP